MSRLIDADALRKRIKAKNASNAMMKAMREECVAEIDDAPTIEPKMGKWVTHKELHKNMCYYIKCSECGKEAIWTNGFSLYPPNFCPNCGADMRGEAE